MHLSRRTLIAAGFSLFDLATAQAATFPLRSAGNWPQRPVKFIIPNAPGSSVDTIGRLLMNEMAKSLQQAAVADNKAGAAGALGAEATRLASPDGYTLLMGSTTAISTAPLLQKAARYDPLVDFELISLVALLPNVLVCNPALPVKTTKDLIAYAKSKGDKSNMASAGVGSASHLAGLAFQSAAGFTSLHVPYKGGSQGVASVVSGETDWVLTPAPAAMSLVAGDRLRLLGHSLPVGASGVGDAPSLATAVPGFEFAGWIGLLAPKGLPPAISTALAETVQKALQSREVIQAFETNGAVPSSSTSAEFRRFLERDIATNKKAISMAGIQAE
ncbi:MAG: tripartite tricarboxylate transporter substrate binding protein [Betaproteobacteria bacterium]